MPTFLSVVVAALGILASTSSPEGGVRGVPQDSRPTTLMEYQAKARLLNILPDYLKWPPGHDPGARPLVLGVIGTSPFDNHLSELQGLDRPKSRKLRCVPVPNLRAVEACDLLFICESESWRLAEILQKAKGRAIVTVADTPGFAKRGVMVNLVLNPNRDRVGLEVNLGVLRQPHFEASPHLLKHALVVE